MWYNLLNSAQTAQEKRKGYSMKIVLVGGGKVGTALARQAREAQPLIQIAFLSGYDDFEYAQQGIENEVVAYLLKPELFTTGDYNVQVETAGEYCRGATVADTRGYENTAKANARCLLNVDREGFVDLIVNAVKSYDGREVPV